MTRYRPLSHRHLRPDTRLCVFDSGLSSPVGMDDNALKVMTDLRRVPAATTHPEVSIDAAMQKMIHVGVRLLFVLDDFGVVVGIITARDILGEKPVQIAAEKQIPRDQVLVEDIMIRRGRIEVLPYAEVARSTVGDIVVTLKEVGRQHALVEAEGSVPEICGIFSISQIGRQLGVKIETTGTAQTFAELEKFLTQGDH
ncbi:MULTISPECIES: CBS domain-containing protein [Acidithiobacillus]|jgi:CBS domain containing-hemolysin-like protein|uniref:CBS domain-containing protein n=4 Tax=Acidithiobacillus caldus TaxID=33059 RepID=F9ZS04_ACICS|nr:MULTISPECIES: CBS domain-containing protein [Acidithiobacillus]AEK58813.1 conserved hypothetical protein [Acidithiobacillus caldus SM-1]AIA55849.1 CBS domain protein [Acidithiobacillus caldus ATCC 51756]AUW33226.1 CBS domain-containing protein [Acidithiobacillus caldus]MBU2730579.1 CBS domain-containing protein [Acidithiobacillus caldus]MBU2736584.1 CBS domain-containing protein [Acidithiobacillus caldus ATCC 51756]